MICLCSIHIGILVSGKKVTFTQIPSMRISHGKGPEKHCSFLGISSQVTVFSCLSKMAFVKDLQWSAIEINCSSLSNPKALCLYLSYNKHYIIIVTTIAAIICYYHHCYCHCYFHLSLLSSSPLFILEYSPRWGVVMVKGTQDQVDWIWILGSWFGCGPLVSKWPLKGSGLLICVMETILYTCSDCCKN